jgi:DnaJ-class molecular chaperone
MINYYAVLQVPPSATREVIAEKYRTLARTLHPDLGGDAYTFAGVTEAWSVLGDPHYRHAYNAKLAMVMDACKKCGGDGVVSRSLSITRAQLLPCPLCHGEGYAERK